MTLERTYTTRVKSNVSQVTPTVSSLGQNENLIKLIMWNACKHLWTSLVVTTNQFRRSFVFPYYRGGGEEKECHTIAERPHCTGGSGPLYKRENDDYSLPVGIWGAEVLRMRCPEGVEPH
ncbi:hypothetical protein TcBrA4_0119050 [Trypanosoma cruzi]|nr:hypothetical protein TcBrA4_0119050 [Trypanosoma cruzi]